MLENGFIKALFSNFLPTTIFISYKIKAAVSTMYTLY